MTQAASSQAICSMTGAGAGAVDHERGRIAVESRSVNHRFLKTTVRVHGALPTMDRVVEETVRRHVQRGHVTVFVRYAERPEAAGAGIDEEAFSRVSARLKDLARWNELRDPVLSDVLRVPGVVGEPDAEAMEALADPARRAVEEAVLDLVAARRREGDALAEEIARLLSSIETAVRAIETEAAERPGRWQERMIARVRELLERTDTRLDEEVVAREVALLADRGDVREEIARLLAHVAHAREMMAKGGAIGRPLDFLVQEFHREANTIGSKANDLDVGRLVVDLKSDVERLREQVQNLE